MKCLQRFGSDGEMLRQKVPIPWIGETHEHGLHKLKIGFEVFFLHR